MHYFLPSARPDLAGSEHRGHEEAVGRAPVPLRRLPVVVHAQVVAHLVRDHEHRLEVVALVDGAGVVGVAHAGNPGQPDHAVLGEVVRRLVRRVGWLVRSMVVKSKVDRRLVTRAGCLSYRSRPVRRRAWSQWPSSSRSPLRQSPGFLAFCHLQVGTGLVPCYH